MGEKKIEIEQSEIEALLRGCVTARKLIASIVPALQAVDIRLRATENWLSTMEFRTRHAEEVEDD